MLKQVRPAVMSVLAFTVLFGLLFPALVWGIAHAAFPRQAEGSLVVRDERVVGSALIGQGFAGPLYFHPRPSAAGDGYDAASSGGTNMGPTNPKLIADVRHLAETFRKENGLPVNTPLPADAVTRSASGLDPHISPENALLQAPRVARERGLPEEAVRRVIARNTENRTLGFLGEPRVNVLKLNMTLDAIPAETRRVGERDGTHTGGR